MRRTLPINFFQRIFVFAFLLLSFIGNAQDIQVEILGGATVLDNSTISFSEGAALTFRITNTRSDCDKVKIDDINVSNTTDFSISTDKIPTNVTTESCKGKTKYVDFSITNISGNCGASTDIIIEVKKEPNDFRFNCSIIGNPAISVLGGSPSADITNGSTITTATNGTYFGVVDAGASVTRNFVIVNTGSCPLDISNISCSPTDPLPRYDFTVPSYVLLSDEVTQSSFTTSIAPGTYVILPVTFTGSVGGTGTLTSTISITNTANTTFNFNVSAEMFDFNIPGPGGITADFRLWLKTTRGIVKDGSSKVSVWKDIGTNGKDAEQSVSANQPTYIDEAVSNINFNPVIKFENNGSSISQFLSNDNNGFYNQDIFIVMVPDVDVSISGANTIFSGTIKYPSTPAPTYTYANDPYVDDANDVTGLGLGDFTNRISTERLWYNQGNSILDPYYTKPGSTSRSYASAAIINASNKTTTVTDGMRILYNSVDDNVASTESISFTFENLGYVDASLVYGTPYIIGKNANAALGNLNGRVAEIFTFAERLNDTDRQKIESYLAIKYGITLGDSNIAQKDYVNSFSTYTTDWDKTIWDESANAGFNYDVAGIGRDSISDLNQKQSKTINETNEVTIGLGGIFSTNSANPNEFEDDGDFLVWGNNNGAYTATNTVTNTKTIDIGASIPTTVTRIDRKWKIVESNEVVNGDVGIVYLSIPEAAFSLFSKTTNEEYVLIVADDQGFLTGDIIDVLPLKSDGSGNLLTWYDFHDTNYFSFGKTSKLSEDHSISIASNNYLVGEYNLDLNPNSFTVSAWVKSASSAITRTIMAKGEKLQMRLNTSNEVEVWMDDDSAAKITSTMQLTDGKWHQISFVYNSGTIFIYIDGVLDKSEQNIEAPTPNYNYLSIGAVYIDKDTVSNPLLGEIDEVYIWNQALSESQIRYLMNQEIERLDISSTDYVSGKVIPGASSSNEVATIPWSTLSVYYDFNCFYGSTVEGLTDARNFLRLNYLVKDKTMVDTQTAPLPYISADHGVWGDAATWSNNVDQLTPNSLSLDGSTIIDWNIVQMSHNITSGDRDISLLGLIQTDGILTIADPTATSLLENNAGQELIITHYLELDGVIDLVGESQLVQTEGSIVDADSGGYIEKDQQGTANGFNYNYWSSSVGLLGGDIVTRGTGVSSTNSNHTLMGVLNNGTDSGGYQSLFYDASPNASGIASPPGLARTLSTAWLYKFYGAADDYYAWGKIDETTVLLSGEGFTMKGTSGAAPISTLQNYVFVGLPNNGDITLELDKTSGDVERLIGNPYPSALDANEFILDNMGILDGGNNAAGTIFNGALYFWDHFGEQNTHYLAGYVGGYATRNLIAGAAAISNDIRINNNAAIGTKVPGPYIPVNQGFFVSTVLDGFFDENGVAVDVVVGGDVIFKNSQRVYATELEESSPGVPVSVFMKTSKGKTESKIAKEKPENDTPTIRLVYDSPLGYHRQLVIGANNKASNGFDLGYDAFLVDVNEEDMYWSFNNNKFVIQGVDKFDETQEFSIGLIVKNGGIATIKLNALENFELNLSILIKDELTGETKNINTEPFEVNLEPGVYNDRFKLVFSPLEASSVIVESTEQEPLVAISYNSKLSELNMTNTSNIIITDMVLYDILGNEIKSLKLNTKSDVTLPVSAITGLYIVKINTENGVETKKIIIE